MELGNNNIVQLRNGIFGFVTSFNGKPSQIVFKAYSSPIEKYSEELKHKNPEYDIVAVFDGSNIENPKSIYLKKFDVSQCEKLWEEETK